MKFLLEKLLCLVILLTVLSCAQKKELEDAQRTAGKKSHSSLEETGDKEQLQIDNRKIIKEGEISFECSNLAETRTDIDEKIKKFEGYISKEDEYTYDRRIEQSVVIRVPAGNFDKLVAEISKGVRKFDRKHIEATDVTEEYLDIELRIRIKKETEKRYRELLKRAKTIEEILSIEKQIGELRAEIESIEGRLKYLQNRITYSALIVTFYETVSVSVGFSSKFRVGLKNGWNNFVWFLVGLVNIWPFILLVLLGFFGIREYRRRRKNRGSG